MKKVIFALIVIVLFAFPGLANADVGSNPNNFELALHCGGEVIHVTIPNLASNGGRSTDAIEKVVGHVRSHYLDFNGDGEFTFDERVHFVNGLGYQTTWCTFTWDNDPFLHGMDIQFVPPK
jgi:hypothetical protein